MIRTFLLVLAALCLAPAAASAQANLEVSFIAPSTVDLYETKRFKARVENTGNADARDVDIYVQLPETRSNPTSVYGVLGNTHRRCSLNGTILESNPCERRASRCDDLRYIAENACARFELSY